VQITISGRHVDVPEEIKDYARKKAEKVLKFYDRIQSIEVLWDHEGDQFSVEIMVNAGARNTFISKEIGPDGLALVDLAVDKLERQITRFKEKTRSRMHTNKKLPYQEELGEGI